jgi:hypothetical protein
VDSQQQIWIGFSNSPTPHIHTGFKSKIRKYNGDRRSPTGREESGYRKRTRRRRSRFVVQGGLGRSIERLSFTLWIYEKQKNKVPYRNQIASSPRLGNALGS